MPNSIPDIDFLTVFSIVSIPLDIIAIASLIVFIFGAIAGLIRPLFRFGWAAWKKQVYIIAGTETGNMINDDLQRSGIVKKKNIKCKNDKQIGDIKDSRLTILDYSYLGSEKSIDIIKNKKANCGAIVYASPGEIKPNDMKRLNEIQHVSVVNFRGRLVNEVLVLLMSCSFSKKESKEQ